MNNESVSQEINELESFIERKVEEKVKVVSNKWSQMGTKQKLDFIFVACGIVAFTLTAIANLKKIRG